MIMMMMMMMMTFVTAGVRQQWTCHDHWRRGKLWRAGSYLWYPQGRHCQGQSSSPSVCLSGLQPLSLSSSSLLTWNSKLDFYFGVLLCVSFCLCDVLLLVFLSSPPSHRPFCSSQDWNCFFFYFLCFLFSLNPNVNNEVFLVLVLLNSPPSPCRCGVRLWPMTPCVCRADAEMKGPPIYFGVLHVTYLRNGETVFCVAGKAWCQVMGHWQRQL